MFALTADFHVDDDGILHDDLDLFKHAVNTAGHGTDSGFGGDKQSSTSTLQHFHASFDEDLAPIGDESINISDFGQGFFPPKGNNFHLLFGYFYLIFYC